MSIFSQFHKGFQKITALDPLTNKLDDYAYSLLHGISKSFKKPKDKAAAAALAYEQSKDANIAATQDAINRVFDNPQRQSDIDSFVQAMRDYYGTSLQQQKGDAERNMNFALARSGLSGGSVNVDQQRLLNQSYAQGVLSNEQRAQQAGASLESQDQDARARLISLATQGLDTTTAAQQAAAALRNNIESGESSAKLGSVADAFANFNKFAQNEQDNARFAAGLTAGLSGGKQSGLYGGSIFGYGGKP